MHLVLLSVFGCMKKDIRHAEPIEDLGDGKFRSGTVQFEGVTLKQSEMENSLEKTENPENAENTENGEKSEQTDTKTYNGMNQYWTSIEDVGMLFKTYEDFIQYEYGSDDDANAQYLLKDKVAVFHQLTGSAYDIVIAERNYKEVSAGIFIAGASELRYAEMWNRYPTPDALDHDAQIVFGEKTRDTVEHLGVEGKEKLDTLLSHYYRSRTSGQFTEMALQELQWRFPNEYPVVLASEPTSSLETFALYHDMMQENPMRSAYTWPKGEEYEQMLDRVAHADTILQQTADQCSALLTTYKVLGEAIVDICTLQQLLNYDVLYVRYPGRDLPKAIVNQQAAISKAIASTVQKIDSWENDEYSVFWKKEAYVAIQQSQYAKIQAMREKGRVSPLVNMDMNLWEYRPEQEISISTSYILDAHLQQIERELRILNYDITHLDPNNRAQLIRKIFIDIPKKMQQMELYIQSCLFAFPEQQSVRSRMLVAMVESYSYYVQALRANSVPETAESINLLITMITLTTSDIEQVLSGQTNISTELQQRISDSQARLAQ